MRLVLLLYYVVFCFIIPFKGHANIIQSCGQQSPEAVQNASYGHMDAKALKSLIDSQVSMKILDAREIWRDPFLISGAHQASASFSSAYFDALLPYPDELIVVYCYSYACPLSGRLAEKLLLLGYTNIIEYPGGLKEWRDIAQYPVDPLN